jgi:hypothetical protein
MSSRIMGIIYSLNRHSKFIPMALKPKLVVALLYPHFYYGDIVFNDINMALRNKIQKLQNACVRFACGVRKFDHITPFYKQLKWQRINEIYKSFMYFV